MDFDPIKNIKCIICGAIGTRLQVGGMNGWQFASNVPFNYICGPSCAATLEAIQKVEKDAREAEKKAKKAANKEVNKAK